MAKRTGQTSERLRKLIINLRKTAVKEKVNLWKAVKKELEKSTRQRRNVNIDRIERFSKEGEISLVPGKVLSDGELTKKINIAAYSFSKAAKEKINKIGKAMTIEELIEKNPKGKNVRIIG